MDLKELENEVGQSCHCFTLQLILNDPVICPPVGGPFVFSKCRVIPRLFITDLKEAFCHSAKWFHLFILLLFEKLFVKQFSCVLQVSHCVKSHKFKIDSVLKFNVALSHSFDYSDLDRIFVFLLKGGRLFETTSNSKAISTTFTGCQFSGKLYLRLARV